MWRMCQNQHTHPCATHRCSTRLDPPAPVHRHQRRTGGNNLRWLGVCSGITGRAQLPHHQRDALGTTPRITPPDRASPIPHTTDTLPRLRGLPPRSYRRTGRLQPPLHTHAFALTSPFSRTTDTVRPAADEVLPHTYTPRGAAAAAACSSWLLPRPGSPTCAATAQRQAGWDSSVHEKCGSGKRAAGFGRPGLGHPCEGARRNRCRQVTMPRPQEDSSRPRRVERSGNLSSHLSMLAGKKGARQRPNKSSHH